MNKRSLGLLLVLCLMLSVAVAPAALAAAATECTGDCTHAAAIGDIHYDELSEAVEDAQLGDTVTLLRDVTLTSTVRIESGKTVTIDLNGKIIDGTENCNIALMSYGNLTVKDSSEGQTGAIKAGKTAQKSGNTVNICGGTFTLESGSIYSVNNAILIDEQAAVINIKGGTITAEPTTTNSAALYISSTSDTTVNITGGEIVGYNGILLWNNSTINMTGGSIDAPGSVGIQGNGNYDNTEINLSGTASVAGYYAAIYHPQAGELNISGNATLTGWTGVVVKGGNVTISGGTISGTGEATAYAPASSGFVDTGDGLYVEHYDNSTNSENYGTPTVTVTGGTFTSTNASAVASYANINNADNGVEAITGFISGGTYSSKPDDSLIVEGAKAAENSGGSTWGIVPDTTDSTVATVGNVAFDSLKAAVAAAKDGDTVKLLASYEDWKAIQVGKTITIDLNGFNINRTFGGAALDITDGTVTITGNGEISGATDGIWVAYDAELKLEEGVTVEGRDGHGVVNNGDLTVDGAAITATEYGIVLYSNSEKNWAASLEMLDGSVSGEYGIAAYANTTVTVKGGTVTGTVAGLAGHGNEHGTTFTVEGGTIQSEEGVGIYHPQNGTLNISGGTIKGATGINIKSGTMNVTGGNIIGTGEDADYSFVGGGFNITGDALAVESCGYPGGAPTVSITGGNFTSKNADAVASYAGNGVTEAVTGFISGGTFSDDSAEAYLADGYILESYVNDEGTTVYGVEPIYTVTIIIPDGASIVVKDSDGNEIAAEDDGTYELVDGTYSYIVSKTGYITKSDSFTVNGADVSFSVSLSIYIPYVPSNPNYGVTVRDAENGDIAVTPASATAGTTVTVTVDPDKGYTLETLTVTNKNGKEIELTKVSDTKYTFKMPASKVTVEATFMEDNTMLNYFVDVFASDYYYDAVLWAVANGITNGTSATTFSPDAICTRAQVVTFLWRAAGSPEPVSTVMPFTDVTANAYYYDAVLWAVENGITNGTSATTFSPDADCTRGQIVTFLWRSQGSEDASAYNPFVDVANDAYYTDAVLWAVENSVTNGTGANTFSPDADCTRAQIVTFLRRCLAQ